MKGKGAEPRELVNQQFRLVVDAGQKPVRIDRFLQSRIEGVSRTKIQQGIDAGWVLVNNRLIKANYKVRPGDEVIIKVPRELEEQPAQPENIPLDIVYEDDDVLVVNKPAGMVVHPGAGNRSGTLVNALLYHFRQLPTVPGNEQRPGLVHRLDKDTSGLLVVARTELAMQHLARQFAQHTVKRSYLALVWGDFRKDSGTITGRIGRSQRNRLLMDVYDDDELIGKPAITHYQVLERFYYVTLVSCHLDTGRTHQIRVHMKYIGHPVFNDATYGGNRILKGTLYPRYRQFVENCFALCPRQALHAAQLSFIHPRSHQQMNFQVSLPADMQQVIDRWRNYLQQYNK
ncbi:MAG: RluA family pseudouridine synthase [Chitinophagales bacterium]|nr:RluA family pseudouridine synthase [Chitinophagales bacterium]MDW8428214.1 RluA family pseudouridine synthase [Chitinophagales bacterium]